MLLKNLVVIWGSHPWHEKGDISASSLIPVMTHGSLKLWTSSGS